MPSRSLTLLTQSRRERGLLVPLGSLFEDQLVTRQFRDGLAKPSILLLELFQSLHLVALEWQSQGYPWFRLNGAGRFR
jgi:hypothetical protein